MCENIAIVHDVPKRHHARLLYSQALRYIPALDGFEDGGNFTAYALIVRDFGVNLLPAVHNGGVVAPAQFAADLEQGGTGLFAHQVHRYLAGPDDLTVALFAAHLSDIDIIVAAHTL